ncbi:RTA1 like protein [Cadophora sp. DSE1049]|nr:RTA1 like protein [Cadophora sp. DSE1049]
MANDSSKSKYYDYDPSLAAAAIFAILFLVSSLFHLFQVVKQRTWYFIPVVIGGLMEFAGYVARIKSARESPDWSLVPYILQALLILVAPALIAASIYMILGRIIIAVDGEKYSLIKKRWLTKIFVTADVVSFLVLSGGSGMLASGDGSNTNLAENIILGGLIIQIIAFGFFVFVAILFHKRMHASPTHKSTQANMPWQKHMSVLYFASILILVRSVIRVIEYIQGSGGYILSHEVFLYVFDAVLMWVAIAIFNFVHPSQMIPGSKRVHDRQVMLEMH